MTRAVQEDPEVMAKRIAALEEMRCQLLACLVYAEAMGKVADRIGYEDDLRNTFEYPSKYDYARWRDSHYAEEHSFAVQHAAESIIWGRHESITAEAEQERESEGRRTFTYLVQSGPFHDPVEAMRELVSYLADLVQTGDIEADSGGRWFWVVQPEEAGA